MTKTFRIISIGTTAVAAAVFCLWAVRRSMELSWELLTALCSLCLFTIPLIAALCRLAYPEQEPLSIVSKKDSLREKLTMWGVLIGFGVAVSLAEYVLEYLLAKPGSDFLPSFRELYYRSDVGHYMWIARNRYVAEGPDRLRLVFLPLYPMTIRLFAGKGDLFLGAFLASQIFSLACLPSAYELFRLDRDRKSAAACARILYLLPGAAFLRVPMSEALFLFLTLNAVYQARKKRYLAASLLSALSALTRSLGILLLALIGIEMLLDFLSKFRQDRRQARRMVPGFLGCLAVGCTGTLAYLLINDYCTGSPFTFLAYQRENWNQGLGLFFNTTAYQTEYALSFWKARDLEELISLSLPNLLCCFGVLGLLCYDRKRMRLSYLAWMLIYYALSVGATWLLSGPRYLAMLFPLALSIQRLTKTKAGDLITETALFAIQTGYLLMLALDMSVY